MVAFWRNSWGTIMVCAALWVRLRVEPEHANRLDTVGGLGLGDEFATGWVDHHRVPRRPFRALEANSAREALVKMCTLPLLAGESIGH